MTTYQTLDDMLGVFRRSSKHGLEFSIYASPHIAAYEVQIYWPKSNEKLSFYVSSWDMVSERLPKILQPYFEKAMAHEKLMDSPLMKALK